MIKDAGSYLLFKSAAEYLPLLFGGLPAAVFLVAFYLHIQRLKSDKFRDALPLYVSNRLKISCKKTLTVEKK